MRPNVFGDLFDGPYDLRFVSDVGFPHLRALSPTNSLRDRADRRRLVDKRHLRAALPEEFRSHFADAADRPGYKNDLA